MKIAEFIDICKLSQGKLKKWLANFLANYYENVVNEDGFLYVRGDIPYALTAHMDTVHQNPVKVVITEQTKKGTIISSPQGIGGDDRCGIYMIISILKETDLRPTIIFCEDEEIGCVGSSKFGRTNFVNELADMNFIIELDRANGNDAVYYDCDNPDFEKYITSETGYKTAWGSMSDISEICPTCGVAGVNFSCGYYNAHTLKEQVVFEEMENTFHMVCNLISKESEQFEYIDGWLKKYRTNDKWDKYYGYGDMYTEVTLTVMYYRNGKECMYYTTGESESDCIASFFIDNPDICYNDVLDWDIM